MLSISFDNLPAAVSEILEKVGRIEKTIAEVSNTPHESQIDRWFNLDELCEYLPDKPKKTSIYALVRKREIPHYKRKELFFLKSEIDNWLKSAKRKTIQEIDEERDNYLSKRKSKIQTTKNQ